MVSDFWRTIPFEEQLEQQGVSAAADLDEICALWPADDDPDKLLRHILRERRRVAKRPLEGLGTAENIYPDRGVPSETGAQ